MTSQIKTVTLLALLSGLLIIIGGYLGGQNGIVIALAFAVLMNVGSYWFSHKIVLSMYKAEEVAPEQAPHLYQMVEELARRANIPMPRVYIIPDDSPNAFATGRNPEYGVVAVTRGLLKLLGPNELAGVLAHEIGHIKNRDILIQTVAAVLASAIVAIAHMLQFAAIFGGRGSDSRGGNPLALLATALLAPIAATIIQLAISRSREYLADTKGAELAGDPLYLAGALEKIAAHSARIPMQTHNPSTAPLFIVNPFAGRSFSSLFSTHPPVEERIGRLRAMRR